MSRKCDVHINIIVDYSTRMFWLSVSTFVQLVVTSKLG